jgi:putative restriction endonuclease
LRLYVYPTDQNWFEFLSSQRGIDEVNFWRPGGRSNFTQLKPGELLLFRLRSPINKIAGGGFFLHSSLFPANAAWDAFGTKNGTPDLYAFLARIARFKKYPSPEAMPPDAQIDCVALTSPFFLAPNQWLDVPPDYRVNATMGRSYDTETATGLALYEKVMAVLPRGPSKLRESLTGPPPSMYAEPILVKQRIGQGGFRILVTDLYDRRCSITGEATLPVLQAAHILPVSKGGTHSPDNGLLLRSDIHTLFDLGYVSIDKSHQFLVSPKLRSEWSNGRVYYDLAGKSLRLPQRREMWPSAEFLEKHNEEVFRA